MSLRLSPYVTFIDEMIEEEFSLSDVFDTIEERLHVDGVTPRPALSPSESRRLNRLITERYDAWVSSPHSRASHLIDMLSA